LSSSLSPILNTRQEPKLWYGIGILYDRYGSLEHAEEAFSQVMRMDPRFEKANEIYFRLGIIYKQQQKFQQSLEVCRLSICRSCRLTDYVSSASNTLSPTLPVP
jgi:tetratricopeptide (TPR) repeat protein